MWTRAEPTIFAQCFLDMAKNSEYIPPLRESCFGFMWGGPKKSPLINLYIIFMSEICSYAIQILILLSRGKKGWLVRFGSPCIVATQAPYT